LWNNVSVDTRRIFGQIARVRADKDTQNTATTIYSGHELHMVGERAERDMATFQVELKCPEHGLERFKIKVIKKYNVDPELITAKYRTRPKREISGIIVGRNVSHTEIRDFMMQYFRETGMIDTLVALKLQV